MHINNLSTIPGLSPFTAVWILAEIGEIHQFSTYRHFLAYCGCCPRVVSSAGKVYSAHVSRHSNAYLRTIFYNAAVVVGNFVKKESLLKEYALHVMKKKRSRSMKLAYCIIAAKIARIVYAVLRDGKPFHPDYGRSLKNDEKTLQNNSFSITEKKLFRRVRNCLKRVEDIKNIGVIGEYSKNLARMFDLTLQGKKYCD